MSFNIFHHHKKDSRPGSPKVGSTEDVHHHNVAPNTGHSSTLRSESPSRSNPPSRSESPSNRSLSKFLADPMRSSPKPEHVGEYVDPMGGSINQVNESDPMNTGA